MTGTSQESLANVKASPNQERDDLYRGLLALAGQYLSPDEALGLALFTRTLRAGRLGDSKVILSLGNNHLLPDQITFGVKTVVTSCASLPTINDRFEIAASVSPLNSDWETTVFQLIRLGTKRAMFLVSCRSGIPEQSPALHLPSAEQIKAYLWGLGYPNYRIHRGGDIASHPGAPLPCQHPEPEPQEQANGFLTRSANEKTGTGDQAALIYEVVTTGGPTCHPLASIVIAVYNQLAFTRRCLNAIWETAAPASYEIIVVDNGSTDGTADYLNLHRTRLKIVSNPENLGFVQAANQGAKLAQGKYLVFLNNDTIPKQGWLCELIILAEQEEKAGIVGAKLLYPDGRLQEAGGIIWRDGTGANYGRGGNPDEARYNMIRDVDYCSGACLLVRRDLFEKFGGLDERYSPGYYEDSDLCFTFRANGWRVLYNPKAEVVHVEGATAGRDLARGMKKYQVINQDKFVMKWGTELQKQYPPNLNNLDMACRKPIPMNILFLDPLLPEYDRQSGYAKLYRYMRLLREDGHNLAYLPENGAGEERYKKALLDMGVKVFTTMTEKRPGPADLDLHPNQACLKSLLTTARYPLVYISFWYTAASWIQLIRQYSPLSFVAVDTHDVHFLREMRQARVKSDQQLLIKALETKERELAAYKQADKVITVTENDQEALLKELPGLPVKVIPNLHEPTGQPPPFAKRKNFLFIGNFGHPPNIDAALYLCQHIFPHISKRLPGVKLFLVGSNPSRGVQAMASKDIIVSGFKKELIPYLYGCRVFIAPILYGAGMKGKIGEALAAGLPVVTTPMGAEGMNLTHEKNAMIADTPAHIADAAVLVYHNERLWHKLSVAGREHARINYGTERIRLLLRELLDEARKHSTVY